MRDLHENSWRAFDFDFCQAEKLFDQATNHLASAMALVLPHHSRWQRFTLVFSVSEHLERVLSALCEVDGAPLLETLSFISSVDKGHFDTIHPLKTKGLTKVFKGDLPRLNSVNLDGTSLHWSIFPGLGPSESLVKPPTTLIESLSLKKLRLFTYNSFAHFSTLIRYSPLLSELSLELDDLSCATLDPNWWSWSMPPLNIEEMYREDSIPVQPFIANLPALRRLSLSLRFGAGTKYSDILRAIHAPGLQSLTLDLRISQSSIEDHEAGAEELNDFVRVMCSPFLERCLTGPNGVVGRNGILSNVQYLEIKGSDLTSVEITQLTYSLTRLRSLKVDQNCCNANVLLPFAARPVTSDYHSAPCPFLEEVEIVEPVSHNRAFSMAPGLGIEGGRTVHSSLTTSQGYLFDLVRSRAERGKPLRRLRINGQDIQIASLNT